MNDATAYRDYVEWLARLIDPFAFRQNPSEHMSRRQHIAEQKATEIVGAILAEQDELLDALVEAHRQVDLLLAMRVLDDPAFRPSQSELWPEMIRRNLLLQRYGRKP